jgi:hypothetical protein
VLPNGVSKHHRCARNSNLSDFNPLVPTSMLKRIRETNDTSGMQLIKLDCEKLIGQLIQFLQQIHFNRNKIDYSICRLKEV